MQSPRLRYLAIAPPHLDDFHRLVRDPHVCRYLMDGEVFPREWSADRIRDSRDLFARRGVGLWLAYAGHPSEPLVGFCGFLELPDVDPEPQLVYALFARHTGRGYATEMARAAIAHARGAAGFTTIVAAVDAPNTASLRVLDRLGFERTGTSQGHFGDVFHFRLP